MKTLSPISLLLRCAAIAALFGAGSALASDRQKADGADAGTFGTAPPPSRQKDIEECARACHARGCAKGANREAGNEKDEDGSVRNAAGPCRRAEITYCKLGL